MKVVITGASGMLGSRVVNALLERGTLAGSPIDEVVAVDVAPSDRLTVRQLSGDLADPAFAREAIGDSAGAIFHLAGIVSGGAEADFDLGYRVNLDGTRNVLEAARALGTVPRVVFTSSIASYGGTMPPILGDGQRLTPQTSYGVQKAIGELLITDYSRKGFIEGRAVRLPNIVVRPGGPNAAASGFTSSIVREPLAGRPVTIPVDPDVRCAVLSPQRAVPSLIHAIELPQQAWGHDPVATLPSVTVSVGEMAEAVRRVGGDAAYDLIEWNPDPAIVRMFTGWPSEFRTDRARELGFRSDDSFDAVVALHVAEEYGA